MTPRPVSRWGAWLLVLTVACVGCSRGSNDPPKGAATTQSSAATTRSLHRGIKWLMEQQCADGSWRSTVYGQMQGGVGDTAIASYSLAQLRPGQVDREQFTAAEHGAGRGAQFLLAQLADEEHTERRDGADYPTYAAALLLLSLHDSRHTEAAAKPAHIARVVDYLKSSQQTAARGWRSDDPRFGGWNQTGAVAVEDARRPGNSNISVTSFALASLRTRGALDDDGRRAAQAFLAHCQNFGGDAATEDGGFYFAPDVDDPLNKAGADENTTPARARSYGSATADGLCALAACGAKSDDPRVVAAIAWLARHDGVAAVPGFSTAEPDGASPAEGLKFYYALALARAIRAYPDAQFAFRKEALIAWIIAGQRADGSWQNSNNVMREDDPLIATSLAIAALAILTAN